MFPTKKSDKISSPDFKKAFLNLFFALFMATATLTGAFKFCEYKAYLSNLEYLNLHRQDRVLNGYGPPNIPTFDNFKEIARTPKKIQEGAKYQHRYYPPAFAYPMSVNSFEMNAFKQLKIGPRIKAQHVYSLQELAKLKTMPKVVAVTDVSPKITLIEIEITYQEAVEGKKKHVMSTADAYNDKHKWNNMKKIMELHENTTFLFYCQILYGTTYVYVDKHGNIVGHQHPNVVRHATFFKYQPQDNRVTFVNSHANFLTNLNKPKNDRQKIQTVMQSLFNPQIKMQFNSGKQVHSPYCTLHTALGVWDELHGREARGHSNNINFNHHMKRLQLNLYPRLNNARKAFQKMELTNEGITLYEVLLGAEKFRYPNHVVNVMPGNTRSYMNNFKKVVTTGNVKRFLTRRRYFNNEKFEIRERNCPGCNNKVIKMGRTKRAPSLAMRDHGMLRNKTINIKNAKPK